MKKLLLAVLILSLSLFATENVHLKNPKIYSSLGDEIYNNLPKIQALKQLDGYKSLTAKIDKYSLDIQKAKKFGFELEAGYESESDLKLDYLQYIRKLKKENDFFVRSAHSSLRAAIDSEDNSLFISIVNSGLIDTRKNKNKIMNYYNNHKQGIKPDGVIQDFIDEAYIKKHKKKNWAKIRKQLELKNIKRIRANDKLKQEALEKRLSEEARLKKEVIRAEQKRELSY